MNYIDILLLIPLLWAVYRGFTRGLIIELAALAALLLGIWGAIHFSWFTSELLIRKFELTTRHLHVISFAITFLVIVITVHLVARLADKLVKAIALGFINRILGVIFGLVKMAFILSIILVVLNTIHRQVPFLPEDEIEKSFLYKPVSKFAPSIFPYLNFRQIPSPLPAPGKEEPEEQERVVV